MLLQLLVQRLLLLLLSPPLLLKLLLLPSRAVSPDAARGASDVGATIGIRDSYPRHPDILDRRSHRGARSHVSAYITRIDMYNQ